MAAAGDHGGVVADGLGVVVFQHRLAQAHGPHLAVRVGIAVEHPHGPVAAGDKLLQNELALIGGAVHVGNHGEIFLFRIEEEHLLLPLEVAAEIFGGVAVLRLDHDGEVEGQTLQHALPLLRGGNGCLGIVHAVLLAQGVEPILGVEGFQQLHAVEAVGDQPLEVVIMAAEQPYIVIGAGDDQLLFIGGGVAAQHIQQCVGEYLCAFKVGNDLQIKKAAVPGGGEGNGAEHQRTDAVGLVELSRRAVGVLVAAEDDGKKNLLAHVDQPPWVSS